MLPSRGIHPERAQGRKSINFRVPNPFYILLAYTWRAGLPIRRCRYRVMPVLCLLYTAKQKKREAKRLADFAWAWQRHCRYTELHLSCYEAPTPFISYTAFARLPRYIPYAWFRPFQARYKSRTYSFHPSETFKIEEMTSSSCCY